MLMDINRSLLMVIDIQETLTPLVVESHQLVDNCAWLIAAANDLKVPLMVTEQYPKGLGHTVAKLQPLIDNQTVLAKKHFSVLADDACRSHFLSLAKEQAIVIGIESSVCILQSVLDLIEMQKQVFVVADTISCRISADHHLAIDRMRKAGAHIVSKEMVVFEWLRTADHADFKHISKTYLR